MFNSWVRGKFSISYKVDVKCMHCGTRNIVTSDIAKDGGCNHCKLPLNWSIPKGTHLPNFIPLTRRVRYLLVSITLVFLSVYALTEGSIYLPYGSKRHALIAHFSGHGLVLPALALTCGLLVGLSVLIDHVDIRPNESSYKSIQCWGLIAGWLFYVSAPFFADQIMHV